MEKITESQAKSISLKYLDFYDCAYDFNEIQIVIMTPEGYFNFYYKWFRLLIDIKDTILIDFENGDIYIIDMEKSLLSGVKFNFREDQIIFLNKYGFKQNSYNAKKVFDTGIEVYMDLNVDKNKAFIRILNNTDDTLESAKKVLDDLNEVIKLVEKYNSL